MLTNTKEFLEKLIGINLFAAVGKGKLGPNMIRVASWDEAAAIADLDTNDDFRMETSNNVCRQIPYDRFQLWNDILAPVMNEVTHILQQAQLPKCKSRLVKSVIKAARWDLAGAAMEHEYADVIGTSFYRDLSKLYLAGHLVCGWDWAEADIRTIVY